MQALLLDFDSRSLREGDMPEPVLTRDDEVLLRVLEVGVCGTDRALAHFEFGKPPAGERRLILGHEALCEVVRTGSQVKQFAPGDLVAPTVRRACSPPCQFCVRGRRDLCRTDGYTERGILGAHGYFTDLAVDRAEDLVRVPNWLREAGVLMEPLSVVEKAVRLAFQSFEDKPRLALVLGAGPIGILTALVLLARGVSVVVHSLELPNDPRARLIRDAGAYYTNGEPPEADLAFECAGPPAAGFLAVKKLAPSGVAVILGASNGTGTFPFRDLIVGNKKVIGSVNANPAAFQEAAHDLQRLNQRILKRMVERVDRSAWQGTIMGTPGSSPKTVHRLSS
jgi:threonine dehydrogenase-like Zn-dependent dehydrogenase